MKKGSFNSVFAVFAIFVLAVSFAGCGAGGGSVSPDNTGTYSLSVNWPDESGGAADNKAVPSNSSTVSVSITGQWMSDPVTSSISSGTTVLTISNIPVGYKVALIKALDASGNITAQRKEPFTINEGQTTTAESVPLGVAVTGMASNPVFEPSAIQINYNSQLYVQNWLGTQVTLKGFSESDMTLLASSEENNALAVFPGDSRTIKSIENVIVNNKGIMNVSMKATKYRIYVTNYSGNTPPDANVSVVGYDNGTLSSLGSVNIGAAHLVIEYSPLSGFLYVGGPGGPTIWSVNPATSGVSSFSTTGSSAITGLNVKPGTDIIYCANKSDNNISRIRTSDNYVFPDKISVGTFPLWPDFSISGDYLYVPCTDSKNIYVINTNTNTVDGSPIDLSSVASLTSLRQVKANPNGKYLYANLWYEDKVSVIDASTRQILKYVPVGNEPFLIESNLDGSKIYVGNVGDDTISVIETANHTVTNTIGVGNGPCGITLSPDGQYLYVCNDFDASLSVVSVNSETVVNTLSTGYSFPHPYAVKIVPIQ